MSIKLLNGLIIAASLGFCMQNALAIITPTATAPGVGTVPSENSERFHFTAAPGLPVTITSVNNVPIDTIDRHEGTRLLPGHVYHAQFANGKMCAFTTPDINGRISRNAPKCNKVKFINSRTAVFLN